jgi:hypothetical protein
MEFKCTIALGQKSIALPDSNHQDTLTTLQYAQFAKNIKNQGVKVNLDDTSQMITQLREEITHLRTKLQNATEMNKDDVLRMEVSLFLEKYVESATEMAGPGCSK